ncbi:hypothetical protein EVAR_66847_1 [Eumeta japonica]|uniref:Uncharacterized protein n=1 Tax=Eumeta variegata TaxID=151549 RepID=A0A4C1ZC70_EUMVA|nr:hypothetical protein EVAR_66847_1 [Eumeta japonica]
MNSWLEAPATSKDRRRRKTCHEDRVSGDRVFGKLWKLRCWKRKSRRNTRSGFPVAVSSRGIFTVNNHIWSFQNGQACVSLLTDSTGARDACNDCTMGKSVVSSDRFGEIRISRTSPVFLRRTAGKDIGCRASLTRFLKRAPKTWPGNVLCEVRTL